MGLYCMIAKSLEKHLADLNFVQLSRCGRYSALSLVPYVGPMWYHRDALSISSILGYRGGIKPCGSWMHLGGCRRTPSRNRYVRSSVRGGRQTQGEVQHQQHDWPRGFH